MELHPTWCWGTIAHGHLVKQPIGVILFKPARHVNVEFLGFVIVPNSWDVWVKVPSLIILAGVYYIWKLRGPSCGCAVGHLIYVELEERVLSGRYIQVPDPIGDLVHAQVVWETLPEHGPNIGDLPILQSASWVSISEVDPCPVVSPAVRLIIRVSICIIEVDLL